MSLKLTISTVFFMTAGLSFSLGHSSEKPDTTKYFTFMGGTKRPFEPKWDQLYIEFNYNYSGGNLPQNEIDSLNTIYKNDLVDLGLIRISPSDFIYRIINPNDRVNIVNKLQYKKEVQKLEALYSYSGGTWYFGRTIRVYFNPEIEDSEIVAITDEMKLLDYSILSSDGEKSLIIRFNTTEILNYSFLKIAEKIFSKNNVLKVLTFDIQDARPN